jgi:hypothetical protein
MAYQEERCLARHNAAKRTSKKSLHLKVLERLEFNFIERENGLEISKCPGSGEVPGEGIEYTVDLKNSGGPSKSQWSYIQLTCIISRIARVEKNECLEHAPETRQEISTIGSTQRGSSFTMCRECVGIYHTLPTLLCRKQTGKILKAIMQNKVDQ